VQNLRDKLLKAGLVNKKQRRRAEHADRQKRRKGKADADGAAEQRRNDAYERKLAAERERSQALEAERRAVQEGKERDLRVLYLTQHHRVAWTRGDRRWHFVSRAGTILYFPLDADAARQLGYGTAAIVEVPGEPDADAAHTLVDRKTADLIWSIDQAYVRFLNRDADERPLRAWELD
jgi:uncharacterized protein YaiL (DUF2058 family)